MNIQRKMTVNTRANMEQKNKWLNNIKVVIMKIKENM